MKNNFLPTFKCLLWWTGTRGQSLSPNTERVLVIFVRVLLNTEYYFADVKYEMINLIWVSRETNEICCSDVILHSETLQWKLVFLKFDILFSLDKVGSGENSFITAKRHCVVGLHLWNPHNWKAKMLLFCVLRPKL